MSDTHYEVFQHYGTNAQRLAFTPAPAAGIQPLYLWYETDTGLTYLYDTSWHLNSSGASGVSATGSPASGNLTKFSGATSITNTDLTGDVTTSGTPATTIANNAVTTAKINNAAVTLAKIANASASSKLVGSGASGSGSAYSEITVGSGLSMTGTTLAASGSGGTVTHTGTLTANELVVGNGSADIKTVAATDGQIPIGKTSDGSVNLTTITAGSGVTVTNGAGSITIAASGGSSGALVALEQHTASGSSSLDFTSFISSTYDSYMFELVDVLPATSTDDLWIRCGTGGGPTWDTGSNYNWAYFQTSQIPNTAALGGGGTFIKIANSLNTGANYGCSGTIRFYSPQAALYKKFTGHSTAIDSATNFVNILVSGLYLITTTVTGVRFMFSTGNIASGTIRVYGIAKS